MTASTANEEIRILYLTGGRRIGGMETHLIALASSLPASVRCFVSCLDASADYRMRLTEAGIEHTNLDCPSLVRPGSILAYRRFERLASQFQPHVVHSYGFSGDVVAAVLRTRRSNIRLITSRRGEDANRRHQAVRRLVNRVSDRIVCVSSETAKFVQSTESPSPSLLEIIPNGVALNPAPGGARIRHPDEPVRFGTLGTVKPIKGTDLLVDAFMRFDLTHRVELLNRWVDRQTVGGGPSASRRSGHAYPVRRTFFASKQLSRRFGRFCPALTFRGYVQRAPRGHGVGPALHCHRCRVEPFAAEPSG